MDEPIIIEKIELKAYLEAVILSESLIAQKLKDLLHNKTKMVKIISHVFKHCQKNRKLYTHVQICVNS